ncbi:hypothetical protein TEA_000178 [Camellia sinensis var. sinensis]|uniref:F-box domain-containing protein n=1 Tax=Camellia sinensis var. sinensis TaxID=542762 RepID=A0A4S4F0P5_CAMSN|nr:hypothetical protein TEA_000178 [Camellia sinensis var. sinensis]
MGANASSFSLQSESSNESTTNPPSKPKLEDIPESCIALVLTHLDPLEICKLARLNQAFRGASSADFIWETKLPSNYLYLLEKLKDQREGSLGKKDLYSRLCRPSSFDGVAYLQQIWWFEVVGELEFQFPIGTYSLFFRLQLGKATKRLGRRICNVDQIHGWDIKPVQFQLTTSDGQHAVSRCFLDNPGNWVHYHAGDFVVDQPNELTKIKFSLTQIDCTHTKGGLCLDSVLICPSSLGKELRSLFDQVAVGRALDLLVYFGETGIGVEGACATTITLDTPGANYRTVWALSKYFLNVKTFVRAHDVDHGLNLEKAKLLMSQIVATINEFRSRHLFELSTIRLLSEASGSCLGYGYSRIMSKPKSQPSDSSDDNQITEGTLVVEAAKIAAISIVDMQNVVEEDSESSKEDDMEGSAVQGEVKMRMINSIRLLWINWRRGHSTFKFSLPKLVLVSSIHDYGRMDCVLI